MLLERHDIGHQLTGVTVIGQAIDDRHRRILRQLQQLRMIISPDHDGIHIS